MIVLKDFLIGISDCCGGMGGFVLGILGLLDAVIGFSGKRSKVGEGKTTSRKVSINFYVEVIEGKGKMCL